MLLPTVNDLIFPRMLMWASLKLAKPAPHSLVLARMEACVVIVMTMIELNLWWLSSAPQKSNFKQCEL